MVVALVLCRGSHARIQPVSIRRNEVKLIEPVALLEELEDLVASVVGDTFGALLALRSRSWSFVEVPDHDDRANAA